MKKDLVKKSHSGRGISNAICGTPEVGMIHRRKGSPLNKGSYALGTPLVGTTKHRGNCRKTGKDGNSNRENGAEISVLVFLAASYQDQHKIKIMDFGLLQVLCWNKG